MDTNILKSYKSYSKNVHYIHSVTEEDTSDSTNNNLLDQYLGNDATNERPIETKEVNLFDDTFDWESFKSLKEEIDLNQQEQPPTLYHRTRKNLKHKVLIEGNTSNLKMGDTNQESINLDIISSGVNHINLDDDAASNFVLEEGPVTTQSNSYHIAYQSFPLASSSNSTAISSVSILKKCVQENSKSIGTKRKLVTNCLSPSKKGLTFQEEKRTSPKSKEGSTRPKRQQKKISKFADFVVYDYGVKKKDVEKEKSNRPKREQRKSCSVVVDELERKCPVSNTKIPSTKLEEATRPKRGMRKSCSMVTSKLPFEKNSHVSNAKLEGATRPKREQRKSSSMTVVEFEKKYPVSNTKLEEAARPKRGRRKSCSMVDEFGKSSPNSNSKIDILQEQTRLKRRNSCSVINFEALISHTSDTKLPITTSDEISFDRTPFQIIDTRTKGFYTVYNLVPVSKIASNHPSFQALHSHLSSLPYSNKSLVSKDPDNERLIKYESYNLIVSPDTFKNLPEKKKSKKTFQEYISLCYKKFNSVQKEPVEVKPLRNYRVREFCQIPSVTEFLKDMVENLENVLRPKTKEPDVKYKFPPSFEDESLRFLVADYTNFVFKYMFELDDEPGYEHIIPGQAILNFGLHHMPNLDYAIMDYMFNQSDMLTIDEVIDRLFYVAELVICHEYAMKFIL